MSIKRMQGAEIIVESLSAHDIRRLYVYPGGTIAPILDVAKQRGIDIFCARHEQGAGYAAVAVARLSGQPQVAMVTSGPGVTNIITSVADAYYDSTPLVLLTGQVGSGDLLRDLPIRQRGFQEVDTVALLRPVTKAQFQVEHAEQLNEILAEAFYIARQGRPGPVVVDLPMDVQRAEIEISDAAQIRSVDNKNHVEGHADNGVEQLLDWLQQAQRPMIIAGQGVLIAQAQNELRQFAEQYGIPVSHSLLGLGAMPSESLLSLGFHGHTGNQYAGKAIHHSDLVIAIGSRLDVRQTGNRYDQFVPNGRVVRIDLETVEAEHGRVRTDLLINADAGSALSLLNQRAAQSLPDWSEWRKQIKQWRENYPLAYKTGTVLKPQQIVEAVNHLTKDQAVICVSGVGSHQHWVARHFDFDYPQRRWLTSGGHGAMGYDLPTAVGAQLYEPDALVLCMVGDGSLQINLQELGAIAEHNLPVKVIVLDNHRLGIVSQFQQLNWEDDPTTGHKWNPDFATIASGYGIKALTLAKADEIGSVLSEAVNHNGPVLVHCLIDEKEDISPMLLAGQTLDGMWPYA